MAKDLVDIDEGSLDQEWIDQPKRFLEHATLLADAKDALERAKARLDVTEAEIENEIRDNPVKYGLKLPVREGSIKLRVLLHADHKKATRKVNRCKHRVNILDAVVTALEHRKRALEKLVDLHGQGYFSKPVTKSKDFEDSVQNKKKKIRSAKVTKGGTGG